MTDKMRPHVKLENKLILRPADWCVMIALVCALLILVGEPLRNDAIVSLGSRLLIVATFGFSMLDLLVARFYQKSHNAYYLIGFIGVVIVSIAVGSLSHVATYVVNIVCFFMLPVYLLFSKTVYDRKMVKRGIYVFNVICTILWTILFFSPYAYLYDGLYGEEIIESLTLGYANANQTGMFLMISIFVSLSALYRNIPKGAKVMTFLQILWSCFMLWLTGSRTCIIIVAVMFVVCIFKGVAKVGKGWTRVSYLAPLVMFALVMIGGEFIDNLNILGGSFDSGRNYIYSNVIDSLDTVSFFLGDFDRYIGGNLHNSYLTIFAIFGVVGLVAYMLLLTSSVRDYYLQLDKSNKSNCIAYWGILGIIAHGAAESTFLTSGMIYAVMFAIMLVLTLDEEKVV